MQHQPAHEMHVPAEPVDSASAPFPVDSSASHANSLCVTSVTSVTMSRSVTPSRPWVHLVSFIFMAIVTGLASLLCLVVNSVSSNWTIRPFNNPLVPMDSLAKRCPKMDAFEN